MEAPTLMQIAFAGGIDESKPAEVLDPTTAFTVLENGRAKQEGGYVKRLGFAAVSNSRTDGTTRTTALRCFAAGVDGKQTCVIDSTPQLDVLSSAGWVPKGVVPECTQQPFPVPSLNLGTSAISDTAVLNGYMVLAWNSVVQNDGAATVLSSSVAVVDAASGAIIRAPQILSATGFLPALATYGNIVMAFVSMGLPNVDAFYLDTTSPATVAAGWVSVGHVATDMSAWWSRAVSLSGGAAVAIVYQNNSGGTSRLTVKLVTTAGAGTSVQLNTSSLFTAGADMSEGGSTLWVAWIENQLVKAQGLNPATLATTAAKATVINVGTGSLYDLRVAQMPSAGAAVYVQHSLGLWCQAVTTSGGNAATNGSLGKLRAARLLGRPTLVGTKLYAHVTSVGAGAANIYTDLSLCEVTPDLTNVALVAQYFRPVAVPVVRGLFYFADAALGTTPNGRLAQFSSTQLIGTYLVSKSGSSQGSAATVYDFASPYRWRAATVNGSSTYLSGGCTSVFDGQRVFESAFITAPTVPFPALGAAGAILLVTGRSYVTTYAHTDANGDIHMSGVSPPVMSANTGGASKKINVGVAALCITSRATENNSALLYAAGTSSLRIIVWATTDGGQPPYYYVGEIANDPTGTASTFVDNIPDATLITGALLYGTGNLPGTNGASQDHRAPPGLTHLVAYNGTLVGAAGSTLWQSSQPIDGEGQWWNPIFTTPLDDTVTGLEVMDGTVYAFTRRHIFAVSGDAPSDNGSAGGLGTPRRIASQDGCIDANSIRSTALGIVFQSQRGVELLNRGAAVDYWGSQVRQTLSIYPTIQAVVADRQNALVRISLGQSRNSSGVVSGTGRDLVFDTTTGGWVSVDRRFGTSPDQPAQDACIVYSGGAYRYAWLATDGTLYVERAATDGSAYLDGSTWITRAAETAKFKAGGIQGRQFFRRALMLERYATDHDLSMALAYNYETSYRTPQVWTAASINSLLSAGWPVTQLQHDAHNDAESQAVGIRLVDVTPSSGSVGNGAASTWLALTLDVTPEPGTFEVPEGAT